jgi:hypothetical protein
MEYLTENCTSEVEGICSNFQTAVPYNIFNTNTPWFTKITRHSSHLFIAKGLCNNPHIDTYLPYTHELFTCNYGEDSINFIYE